MRRGNGFTEQFTLETWCCFTELNLPPTTYDSRVLSIRAGPGWGKNKTPARLAMLSASFRVPKGYKHFSVTVPGSGADHSTLTPRQTGTGTCEVLW